MQATLIENNGKGRTAYDSLILENPKAFSALNSKIALKIVKSLAESPVSAIDISRKLKIHEQKVYYHVRRLERAGIIYTISNEKRHGMIAKIYSVVSPVISAKLYDKGVEIKERSELNIPSTLLEFFKPFIQNGRLDTKIIIGDPAPHGEFDSVGMEGAHITDLIFFLGKMVDSIEYPTYKLDTEVTDNDLKNNVILIGNPKTNTIVKKLVENIPINFNSAFDAIQVKNNLYKDDRIGFISKFDSPFARNKKVLIIGGLRTRGIRAATIALTRYIDKFNNVKSFDNLTLVAQGLDKDGDKIIDDIIFLE